MKINGNNIITSIFLHRSVPSGSIYTPGDIVIHNNTLFVCKLETSSTPNAALPSWELYTENLANIITDFPDLFDSFKSSNAYVKGSVLKDYIQAMFPGLNPNGTLKTISSGSLNDINFNSKFRLDNQWMQDLQSQDDTTFPFDILTSTNIDYFLTTNFVSEHQVSGAQSENLFSSSITLNNINQQNSSGVYYQEILQIDNVLFKAKRWYKVGTDLSSAVWNPVDINNSISNYIQYINKIVNKYSSTIDMIESFFDDINNEKINMWRSLDIDYQLNINPLIFDFSTDISDSGNLNVNKYYKLLFKTNYTQQSGQQNFVFSIIYTPKYFTSVLVLNNQSIEMSKNDLILTRISTTELELTIPTDYSLIDILESSKLI